MNDLIEVSGILRRTRVVNVQLNLLEECDRIEDETLDQPVCGCPLCTPGVLRSFS